MKHQNVTNLQTKKKNRTWWIIFAIISIIIISTSIQTYMHQLTVPSPISGNIVVFSLFNINIILLAILVILVLRNLIKLYFERKRKDIGYKFRTKLVMAFVLSSLIQITLLFLVASGFITSSIDNWFKVQVEKSLSESLEIAQTYYSETGDRAIFHANEVATIIAKKNMLDPNNKHYLRNTLNKHVKNSRVDGIYIFDEFLKPTFQKQKEDLPFNADTISFSESLMDKILEGDKITDVQAIERGSLITGFVPIRKTFDLDTVLGVAAVYYYIPQHVVTKINSITNAFENYKQLILLKRPIKANYVITFLMITLVILFSATWFGFYLAKGITVPIQELALATRSIAEGNLDFSITVKADDEIGILVDSFNHMTKELNIHKEKIETASEKLRISNIKLEQRRNYIETVLENVATGVISLDKQGKVTMINKSAVHILEIPVYGIVGENYRKVFDRSHLHSIREAIKEMNVQGRESIEKELHLMVLGRMITLLTNISVLKDINKKYLGIVVVFEDLTELIKTQKLAAWREVARSIAHEIKNPLTPIQLNTQRLQRKFHAKAPDLNSIFDECTNTIITEVDGLKKMVNEFSKFAKMPEPNLKPNNIHQIIDDAILLYKSSAKNINIETDYSPDITLLSIDSEQIKRVFINLIDNSIESINNTKNGSGQLKVKTTLNKQLRTAKIEFSDDGEGIPPENVNKVFLPYFSTKKGGTGLGLAIVNRVIADHDGTIKTRNNRNGGITFTIELPCQQAVTELSCKLSIS